MLLNSSLVQNNYDDPHFTHSDCCKSSPLLKRTTQTYPLSDFQLSLFDWYFPSRSDDMFFYRFSLKYITNLNLYAIIYCNLIRSNRINHYLSNCDLIKDLNWYQYNFIILVQISNTFKNHHILHWHSEWVVDMLGEKDTLFLLSLFIPPANMITVTTWYVSWCPISIPTYLLPSLKNYALLSTHILYNYFSSSSRPIKTPKSKSILDQWTHIPQSRTTALSMTQTRWPIHLHPDLVR